MRLGKAQRWVLLLGALLIVGAVLFPSQKSGDPNAAVRTGRKFLFSADKTVSNLSLDDLSKIKPDFGRMSIDVIVIGAATAAGVVVLGAFTMASKTR